MDKKEIRENIEKLLSYMREGAFERGEVIALSLLASLAGESIFLLGLPGVGKSMISRRLKMAFKESRSFEYLMSRFSTPDEIFGPVAISKLKDDDTYERMTDGYLPTADIVFLDEIWKAGPAIQNSLLTVLNEKIFRNGKQDIKLPLKGVISASNELPAEGEGLEALWDRFIIRYVVEPIRNNDNFIRLLTENEVQCVVPEELKFTSKDFEEIQSMIKDIDIPRYVIEIICSLRDTLNEAMKRKDQETYDENESIDVPYISDRRWRKIIGLLRCSALLNGRNNINISDCLLMEHMLWDNENQTSSIKAMLSSAIARQCNRMSVENFSETLTNSDLQTANRDQLVSPDGIHYIFVAAGEQILIDIKEYDELTSGKTYGYIDNNNILHTTDENCSLVISKTKRNTITINSFVYQLKTTSTIKSGSVSDMINMMDDKMQSVKSSIEKQIDDNIFLRNSDQYIELCQQLSNAISKINKLRH